MSLTSTVRRNVGDAASANRFCVKKNQTVDVTWPQMSIAQGGTDIQYPTLPAACHLVFLLPSQKCCLKFTTLKMLK
jgi:hypothetical protein